MWANLLKGFIIGLITGMPTGPIGAQCLRITIANGAVYGLVSGLGSALADSIFASIAALGLKVVSKFMIRHQLYFRFFGGLILIGFGIHILMSKYKKIENDKEIDSRTLLKSFISTFVLALANPSTILSFIVVFAGSGLAHMAKTPVDKAFLIAGVFLGSELWWLILIFTAGKLHHKLNNKNMNTVNKALGSLITFSGIIMVLSTSQYEKLLRPPFIHSKLFELLLRIKIRFPRIR